MNPAADSDPQCGQILWAQFSPTEGKEYSGHRPALVISNDNYHQLVTDMVVTLPITTVSRGWLNHVPVSPLRILSRPSWIVVEQPRAIARSRITKFGDVVDDKTMTQVEQWLDILLKREPVFAML